MSLTSPTYPSDQPILKQVAETIDKHAMFEPGDKVLVGVSGGPDSVALVHILNTLSPSYSIDLAVAHLNHGLRPQVDLQETEYVEQLAKELGLDFHVQNAQLDPSAGSLEERARDVRYRFFDALAKAHGHTKIALGHQADDDAEAVLLHLLRGSGLRGLCGIPPVRDQRIVRPLIDLRRNQIVSYLESRHIHYMLDASNSDLRFDRNRVRHQLLPLLQEAFNPNVAATLHRMAALCRDEDQWFEAHLQPLQVKLTKASSPHGLSLDLDLLNQQPAALKRRLIRSCLRQWRGHLKRINARHIEALLELAAPDRTRGRINLPAGLAAERRVNELRFTQLDDGRLFPDPATPPFQHTIDSAQSLPKKINIPEADAGLTFTISAPPDPEIYRMSDNHTAWFDLDRLNFPLHIRNGTPGDRFAPLGVKGTQKLKKLFIDCKIPQHQRSRTPILASSETIYWVAGLRRSSAAMISQTTRQALCVTCAPLSPAASSLESKG